MKHKVKVTVLHSLKNNVNELVHSHLITTTILLLRL